MANFIDKFNINTAITDNTKMDLGHQHITTANFMQLNPVLVHEMVPGERLSVNMMTFSRMQPLVVPTFGRANIKERAFFVPMRTIFRGWNDFITDTPHIYSGDSTPTKLGDENPSGPVNMLLTVPTVSNIVLMDSFVNGGVVMPFPGGGSVVKPLVELKSTAAEADIIAWDGSADAYLKLTSVGRQWLKILESLGYKIVWDSRNEDVYSAMPILALCKVFVDWYFPSAYVNTGVYVDIMGMLNNDSSQPIQLTAAQLSLIAKMCLYVNYDSDYFVSAWDNPVAPNTGVYSNFKIIDITTLGAGSETNGDFIWGATTSGTRISDFGVSNESSLISNGTPVVTSNFRNLSSPYNYMTRIGQSVSDYQHKALTALTDYMKRHQLVGARAMDRYLARFGKQLNVEQLNRCNYIASKMVPLQIGDVISTSNAQNFTTGMATNGLGDFAGKGMAVEQNFSFDWSTNEYGFLMVISSIVPSAGIYQGLNRHVLHKSKLDFWTPEFDNLGVQAISTRELYNGMKDTSYLSTVANSYCGVDNVFGFAPRYGEYKYCNDQLTGDFVCDTLNANSSVNSAWHLLRTFDKEDFWNGTSYNYSYLTHSRNFVTGLNDHYQYDRIFTYSPKEGENTMPDPFTCIYDFQMVAFAPMKPLYETYEFEDKGQKVQEQVNGVKVN